MNTKIIHKYKSMIGKKVIYRRYVPAEERFYVIEGILADLYATIIPSKNFRSDERAYYFRVKIIHPDSKVILNSYGSFNGKIDYYDVFNPEPNGSTLEVGILEKLRLRRKELINGRKSKG